MTTNRTTGRYKAHRENPYTGDGRRRAQTGALSRCTRANSVIHARGWRPTLWAVASLLLIPCISAPARAVLSTSQTFELKFTLTDILEDATGQTIDPFLLDDIEVFGQALPNSPFISVTGTGVATSTRTEFFNGVPLGPFDDFQLEIGDMFSTVQTNNTSVPSAAGLGQLFELFAWDISVENSSFEDLQFVFDWEYTRDIDLVETGAGESAIVFLDEGTVFIEGFEGFEDTIGLFPDQLIPGNNPLNIGTSPPGFMTTLTDAGTFTLAVHGVDSQSSTIAIEWQIGARSLAEPEPAITGDMDCDGDIDFDDIDDFVLGLNNPVDYENQFGVPPAEKGDADNDGDLDFDDIDDFVNLLNSPVSDSHNVPEPSAMLLAAIAMLAACGWQRRKRR